MKLFIKIWPYLAIAPVCLMLLTLVGMLFYIMMRDPALFIVPGLIVSTLLFFKGFHELMERSVK